MILSERKPKLYSCVLPSNKKRITFRPYTVEEQKNFLMETQNENTEKSKYRLIYEIVKICCKENIDDLFMIDFEYLFLQIRKYAKGNEVELNLTYTDKEKDIEEPLTLITKIDEDIKFPEINDTILTKEINDNDDIIKLEQPKIRDIIDLEIIPEEEQNINLIARMIKTVKRDNKIENEFSMEDKCKYIKNFLPKTFAIIDKFIEVNPHVYIDKKYKLKSGKELSFENFNMHNFFLSP